MAVGDAFAAEGELGAVFDSLFDVGEVAFELFGADGGPMSGRLDGFGFGNEFVDEGIEDAAFDDGAAGGGAGRGGEAE